MANGANVAEFDQVEAMVDAAMSEWGRVDILINNAGILRDKTFQKVTLEDFRAVIDVHLMGSMHCTKAVWEIMREQQYGRIVFTTSSSGLYGNFGQSNYGAAKMAVVGLMNTLCMEGAKYDIRVNCLAPTAATRMTEDIMPAEILQLLQPEPVSAGMLALVAKNGPNRRILAAGGGGYAISRITETPGVSFAFDQCTPEAVAGAWSDIEAADGSEELTGGFQQSEKFVVRAAKMLGLDLSRGKS
jgi:NAD(P)-dependent dehydrogenase (short-subunit alcohol dehydrogenase family)